MPMTYDELIAALNGLPPDEAADLIIEELGPEKALELVTQLKMLLAGNGHDPGGDDEPSLRRPYGEELDD